MQGGKEQGLRQDSGVLQLVPWRLGWLVLGAEQVRLGRQEQRG